MLEVRVGVETILLFPRFRKLSSESADSELIVEMETTPCNFGGSRHWFVCPSCRKKTALLYFNYQRFACRSCLKLAYASQSLSPRDRTWRRQQKIESRLAGTAGEWDGQSKPKRMHFATFERLCTDLVTVQRARGEIAADSIARWSDP
jgi:hypothetical protein